MTDPNTSQNPEPGKTPDAPLRVQATKRQWIYVVGSLVAFVAAIAVVASI